MNIAVILLSYCIFLFHCVFFCIFHFRIPFLKRSYDTGDELYSTRSKLTGFQFLYTVQTSVTTVVLAED